MEMTKSGSSNPQFLELLTSTAQRTRLAMSSLPKELVASAVCSLCIPKSYKFIAGKTEMDIDELRANGYCLNLEFPDKNYVVPVISAFQVLNYIEQTDRKLHSMILNAIMGRDEQSRFGGTNFEIFHGAFECLQRTLWLQNDMSRPTQVGIRALYERAATFSNDFNDQQVPLFSNYTTQNTTSHFQSFFIKEGKMIGKYFFYLRSGNILTR
jgi:hypothetical protein